jgi:hypothetical protein
MSTRESMRRELKELAKLAETMRKESEAKASADLYAYEPQPEQQPGELALTTSSVTVPPVVPPSVPPPDDLGEVDLPVLSRGRGRLAVFVGAGLAVALVGGAALGRSLASQRAVAHAPAPVVAAAAAVAPLPPQPADLPAPPAPAAAAPVIESTIVAPAPPTPPASNGASPAIPRRRTPGPGLRRFTKAGPAKGAVTPTTADAPAAAGATDTDTSTPAAPPAPKPAAAAKPAGAANAAPQTTSGDSLEDMIRKAVAAPAKK